MYKSKFKKILIFLWNMIIDLRIYTIDHSLIIKDQILKLIFKGPEIKSVDETLTEIINKKASICRYGDGEFKLINNSSITFQDRSELLSKRLKDILLTKEENFLVCLPDVFQDLTMYDDEPRTYWRLHLAKFRLNWYKILKKDKTYYNSFISRFYYPFKDKSKSMEWVLRLKLIWDKRDIVLIEGRKSRLGVGNNLFDNVNSIERILVSEENAFFQYDQILKEAKKCDKTRLILIAAGPTATVLAYDLFLEGYQAIDIGHVDIEYEWLLRGVKEKVEIENKYVCEAGAGQGVGELKDKKYLSEIKVSI